MRPPKNKIKNIYKKKNSEQKKIWAFNMSSTDGKKKIFFLEWLLVRILAWGAKNERVTEIFKRVWKAE